MRKNYNFKMFDEYYANESFQCLPRMINRNFFYMTHLAQGYDEYTRYPGRNDHINDEARRKIDAAIGLFLLKNSKN